MEGAGLSAELEVRKDAQPQQTPSISYCSLRPAPTADEEHPGTHLRLSV